MKRYTLFVLLSFSTAFSASKNLEMFVNGFAGFQEAIVFPFIASVACEKLGLVKKENVFRLFGGVGALSLAINNMHNRPVSFSIYRQKMIGALVGLGVGTIVAARISNNAQKEAAIKAEKKRQKAIAREAQVVRTTQEQLSLFFSKHQVAPALEQFAQRDPQTQSGESLPASSEPAQCTP